MAGEQTSQPPAFGARGLAINLIVNVAFPLALYQLSKQYISDSEVVALVIAAVPPIVASAIELIRIRRLNVIGILVILGIAVSLVGLALGGGPKVLLIRESFVTGALGLACFVSLALPRPLMYYFALEFVASGDPVKIAKMEQQFVEVANVRRVHRLITIVWGFVYSGEFVLRVALVYTLPTAVVLTISPIILTALTVATIAWTMSYVNRMRRLARERGFQVD